MDKLVKLAERCEAADSNFDALFMEAFEAVFGGRKSLGLQWSKFCAMLDAEAYESAALMLVPGGAVWCAQRNPDGTAMCLTLKSCAEAATPALAIIAAALRAIAARGLKIVKEHLK